MSLRKCAFIVSLETRTPSAGNGGVVTYAVSTAPEHLDAALRFGHTTPQLQLATPGFLLTVLGPTDAKIEVSARTRIEFVV